MQPNSTQDYKQLLTDVIKKQIVILGPDITLSKARNVKGLTVADDGTVTNFEGSAQEVTQALIDQFVQLSGLIVKKTMEPLLLATQQAENPQTPESPVSATPTPTPAVSPAPESVAPLTQPTPAPVAAPAMPATTPAAATQPEIPQTTMPQPVAPIATPAQPTMPQQSPTVTSTQSAPVAAQPTPQADPAPQTDPAPQPDTKAPADNPLAA